MLADNLDFENLKHYKSQVFSVLKQMNFDAVVKLAFSRDILTYRNNRILSVSPNVFGK